MACLVCGKQGDRCSAELCSDHRFMAVDGADWMDDKTLGIIKKSVQVQSDRFLARLIKGN